MRGHFSTLIILENRDCILSVPLSSSCVKEFSGFIPQLNPPYCESLFPILIFAFEQFFDLLLDDIPAFVLCISCLCSSSLSSTSMALLQVLINMFSLLILLLQVFRAFVSDLNLADILVALLEALT
jgi:hypothetical protein